MGDTSARAKIAGCRNRQRFAFGTLTADATTQALSIKPSAKESGNARITAYPIQNIEPNRPIKVVEKFLRQTPAPATLSAVSIRVSPSNDNAPAPFRSHGLAWSGRCELPRLRNLRILPRPCRDQPCLVGNEFREEGAIGSTCRPFGPDLSCCSRWTILV